jgi:hypothetical protein
VAQAVVVLAQPEEVVVALELLIKVMPVALVLITLLVAVEVVPAK